MVQLCVNIDHVATLREARGGIEPEPVTAALIAELAGAVGIVCHLREDRRHINDRDLRLLRETIQTKLDLEMAAEEEILGIAIEVLPDLVTFVPEKREELTTEGGLDILDRQHYFADCTKLMHEHDIEVSFFLDPDAQAIEAAAKAGADLIELHTGNYANARSRAAAEKELERLRFGARIASQMGMRVVAGHGLNYLNTTAICTIPEIEEVSIGHSLISRAVFVGIDRAVREMIDVLKAADR